MKLPPIYKIKKIPINYAYVVIEEDINKQGHLKHINMLPLHGNIDLLIEMNAPAALEPMEVCHALKKDNTFAVCTRLGWEFYIFFCRKQ